MYQMTYHFKSSGKPVMLLLHGFLGNKNQWENVADQLVNTYDLLMVELPGHGASASASAYTIVDLALEISQYLKQQHIVKVHFVGHSMGGYVGAAFAKAYPQQLYSLTLVNSLASADLPARKQMRNRAIELIDRFQDAYVSMAINNLFTKEEHERFNAIIKTMTVNAKSMSVESVLAALRAMRDRPSVLLDTRIPVQYIYGSRDTVIDKSFIEKEIESFNLIGKLIDGGHMLLLTHPKELIKSIHFIE